MVWSSCNLPHRVFVAGMGAVLLIAILQLRASEQANSPLPATHQSTADLAAWIDVRIARHFAESGATAPARVDDATFLRRTYLDLHGTIPTVSQVRDFLDEDAPDKRARLVDQLIDDGRSAAHLARTWRRIWLADNGRSVATAANFEAWLRERFVNNVAYNTVVQEIVTAGGAERRVDDDSDPEENVDRNPIAQLSPAAEYLQAAGGDPASVAGAISRDFLGIRLECAQCHDHPFAEWKQDDFWGVAAFFAGARYTGAERDPRGQRQDSPVDEPVATITPADIGKSFDARLPGNDSKAEIAEDKLPRRVFADWLTSAENPHFAATAVNRVWQQLCGRGLTDSVDEIDVATPAERAVILDDLADAFADHGFDMKWLIGGICKSKAYQFAAEESERSGAVVGVRPLKVLSPEQVFDALETALGLPISRIDEGPRYNGQRDQLVARLNEAASRTPDDFRAGLPQMLLLMNGSITADATNLDPSRTLRAVVESPFLDDAEKIDTLFLATLTRHATLSEAQQLHDHIAALTTDEKRNAYAQILWALVNGPEFVLLR